MIENGIYYGARDGARLVAVAGTHVISRHRRIGAIGGVLTHPDYRGRGLATATTGAVARALVDQGINLIILNVRADNAPAVAAYSRLGFRPWRRFTEGRASRR
jgi:predicted GNAT family acetyltransferase